MKHVRSELLKLLLAGLLGLLAYFCAQTAPITGAEALSQDWRIRMAAREPRAKIILVQITPQTNAAWPEPMVFWWPKVATALDRIRACGAASVGFDVMVKTDVDRYLQSGPSNRTSFLEPFVNSIQALGEKIVLPSYVQNESGRLTVQRPIERLSADLASIGNIGSVNLGDGEDGGDFVRRSALEYSTGTGSEPTFAALIAERTLGLDPFYADSRSQLARIAALRDPDQAFSISYVAKPFERFEIQDLLRDPIDPNVAEALRGAVVLIGADVPDDNDHWRTPFRRMSGLEIHANIVSTFLDGAAIQGWSRAQVAWYGAVASLLFALIALFPTPIWSGVLSVLSMSAAAGGAFYEFFARQTMAPMGGPLALALTAFGVALGVRALHENAQRRQIEAVFGTHVSEEIRNYLLASPENLALGGVETVGSVLFVDVWDSVRRGSTRTPAVLIAELNELFQAIIPAVTGNRGLINRFTGDGFIAVFGAPAPSRTHADDAVRASLAIEQAVDALNQKRSGDPFVVSCGVHSGPFVCGNLGSRGRSEFTVIGDVVNTAARIESANRSLKSRVLVSEETFSMLQNPVTSDRQSVVLKGKGLTEVRILSGRSDAAENDLYRQDSLEIEAGREP